MRPVSYSPQKFIAVAAAASLSLFIAGCGGGDGGASPSSGTSATSSAAPAETASAEPSSKPAETASAPAATKNDSTSTESSTAPAADPGATGTLVGSVVFSGDYKPLPLIHKAGTEGVKDGSVCAKHDVPNEALLVNMDEGNGVANAFIYLPKAPKGYTKSETPAEPLVMDQKGCVFLPRAMIVQTGQTVLIKSDDEVPHNVHTFPTFQESFNQICQPKERDGLKLVYEKVERQPVEVKCDIHPWMKAWHLPVDHPFAAASDASGKFRIEGLPVGVHKFRVWHEKAGQVEKSLEVTISADAETEITVTINQDQLAQNADPVRTILLSSLKK
jgi:plastocyanin